MLPSLSSPAPSFPSRGSPALAEDEHVAVGVGLRELLAPIRPRHDWPEVQELIRREILRGTICVRPKPGGGIRIVPVGMPEGGELSMVKDAT